MFEITYVSDGNTQRGFTTVRILGKKYLYEFDLKDAVGYEKMSDLSVTKTTEEKIICGLKCKRAVGKSASLGGNPFDIFYTSEIDIADPNLNSPFKEIEGVLMAFTVNLNNISMELSAESVNKVEIDDKIFEIPEGYTSMTKEEMMNIMNEFNSNKVQ